MKEIFNDACGPASRAERLAFLVDGADYFSALHAALCRAERSVLITTWDIDSHTWLVRDGREREAPTRLAALFYWLLEREPELEIHVLSWDYAVFYTFERESVTKLKEGFGSHPRLHFELDPGPAPGGSQHQKIVAIDDEIAFVGGLDLGRRRWDTPAHAPDDARRVTPKGYRYRPHHDLQALVSGDAARTLSDVVRWRWKRARGEELAPPERSGSHDPWPPEVPPAARDVPLRMPRTWPESEDEPAVLESLEAHRRLIQGARRFLFTENQYLTSHALRDELVARLEEEEGPELVLLTKRRSDGWLEHALMGALRAIFVERLRRADSEGRTLIAYPVVDGHAPNLHSKVLIADDRLAYVGSANISNRSMGLDSEIGLLIDAGEREDLREALAGLRRRLLAEHLGVEPARVLEEEAATESSLIEVIEKLNDSSSRRYLEPLSIDAPALVESVAALASFVDMEKPITAREVLDEIFGDEPERRVRRA